MSPAVYFAPTYFSTFYFPSLDFTIEDTFAGYRDCNAFAAIVATLEDTGEFAEVVLAGSIEQSGLSADRIPSAVIVPTEWCEIDDVDPTVNLRQVSFTLTLLVRHSDSRQRLQMLDRLTSIVQNTIDGTDLDGGCLPNLTKLIRGRYEANSKHPDQHVTLTGCFSYFVYTNSGHDTTP
jgi:hypothetical protein